MFCAASLALAIANHARPIGPELALPANYRYQFRKQASPLGHFSQYATSADPAAFQHRRRCPIKAPAGLRAWEQA